MNPPVTELPSTSMTSKVIFTSAPGAAPLRNVGFASIVHLKDSGCPVTRGRRIQISQLGSTTATSSRTTSDTNEDIHGRAMRKRWSFHCSTNQATDLTSEDAMQPLSSKRRKSGSGLLLTRNKSDGQVFQQPLLKSTSREPSQSHISSSKHVLTNQQQVGHRHHRRSSSGKIVLKADSNSFKSRQKFMDEYIMKADPFSSKYHRSFRFRDNFVKEIAPAPDCISTMPDEVLLRICKHLPKAALGNLARTSQRFLGFIEDDTLWKRLCVMGKNLSPPHMLIIMSRKPVYLRMARTSIPDPIDLPCDSDMISLAESSQLLYLDLSSADISPSTLSFMMKISPKLVKLSLEHLHVTKDVMLSMMCFTATIEVLNLTLCYDVDVKTLVQFLLKCQKLREFNLGCLTCEWSHEDLTTIVNALPHTVQMLNISGYRNVLDNSHVLTIVSRCPKLVELDISDSQEVQAKSLEYIMKLSHLHHLSLSRCYGIEAPSYPILAGHKSLKYLDLFSLFKESAIRHLNTNLPGIEINKYPFSGIARPTVGQKRSSIWLQRVRD